VRHRGAAHSEYQLFRKVVIKGIITAEDARAAVQGSVPVRAGRPP
jgi:hypothetical protein